MSYYLIILNETEIHTVDILPIVGVNCIFSSTYNKKDVANLMGHYFNMILLYLLFYFLN